MKVWNSQEKQEKIEAVQMLIDEGLNSGVSSKTMGEILKEAQKLAGQG
jgi:hypothetical protein